MLLLQIIVVSSVLLIATTSAVYNITPDDSMCSHCQNLEHYLQNVNHFTSNSQLHFLPGLHRLPTDLIIQNVNDISLIGSKTNDTTPNTVIQCTSSVGIEMTNITNLTIANMIVQGCKTSLHSLKPAVFIKECSFVQLHYVHIYHASYKHVISLLGINILGESYMQDITCFEMHFYYNEISTEMKNHTFLVNRYSIINNLRGEYGIYLNLSQYSYKMTFQVSNTSITKPKRKAFICAISHSSTIQNMVLITNCQFSNNSNYFKYLFYSVNVSVHFNCCQFYYNTNLNCEGFIRISHVEFAGIFHCNFINNHNILLLNSKELIQVINVSNTTIKHCYFYSNNLMVLYAFNSTVLIHSTTISTTNYKTSLCGDIIMLDNTRLWLSGPVIFHKNRMRYMSIITMFNSNITALGYIEFSRNRAVSIINIGYTLYYDDNHCQRTSIQFKDNTTITIISNEIYMYFTTLGSLDRDVATNYECHYPQCLFQYYSTRDLDNCIHTGNYSIIIENNIFKNTIFNNIADLIISEFENDYILNFLKYNLDKALKKLFAMITHCYWLPQSSFTTTIPLDVNRQYIQYKNNSQLLQMNAEKTLCYCSDKKHDCFKDELGYLYPGQTLTVAFYVSMDFNFTAETEKLSIIAELNIKQMYASPCKVINAKETIQLIDKNCTEVKYTISFPINMHKWCELFLKTSQTQDIYDIFYIRELPCPLGFVKIDGICQCYPSFKQFGFTDCDINTQTILHPSRGWISMSLDAYIPRNSSFSCYISKQCPFDYCKTYSFYLNLSTPDSQCQFNRCGLLCGQCKQGLSTIFDSSNCQHCSNIYLLLIIPIAIAGLALVFSLFVLNLTVTDGTINPFILYVNIVSINSTMFFPDHHTITDPLHIFISFANLDLGIKICFYNGMDDYAKVWLQLAFPFYIISVTLLIIIVSRYSITVQRLTAHRAIPVLATLFLLSYTKILRITSNVLFFYSSTTHLPDEHTELVWSVDANMPLFGIKFTLLFITCLMLYLMLLLFTGFTLCPKAILKKIKLSNNIKPLSDSYQMAYKINYWFGIQLLMRIIFFYTSILNIKHKFIISYIILNIANGFQGMRRSFKNKLLNYQELFLMINLLVLYIVTLYKCWLVGYVLISLVGIHFSLIISCRIMTHLCGRLTARILSCWILNKYFYMSKT